jgi:predicted AAA+ superfamily ATPase
MEFGMDTTGIEFKRKAYDAILEWKNHLAGKTALLVEGARRVGKTHLVRRFVEREYDSHIFIDFSEKGSRTRAFRRAFEECADTADLLERLQIAAEVSLIPGRSCIVFDEVQRFPSAREAIKQLVAYGKYHYIETGSLLGIAENVKDIVIPSEEHCVKLHPLDFEEFLWATGNPKLAEVIRDRHLSMRPLGRDMHAKANTIARQYMVVGGMPQSLAAYLTGDDHRLEASEAMKREILRLYSEDIGKYAKGYAPKVRAIFRHIPGALNTREKKFRLADMDANARMRRYDNAFLWLSDAMVANIAYNSTNPDVGLEMSLDSSLFKCYAADTGLLVTQAMTGSKEIDGRVLRGILYDKLGVNEGMFLENYVSQALVASGYDLLFHSEAKPKMEIDFLIRDGIKACPIEVKSAACRRHASLDLLMRKYPKRLGRKYVLCAEDLFEEGGVTYLPFYMAHCL